VSPQDLDLELIESVLTNYLEPFCKVCLSLPLHPSETCMPAVILKSFSCSQHSETLSYSYYHPTPPLCSERSAFPLALRGTRIVFLLLKQFSSELETDAEVILTLLIRLIGGETDSLGG
jgi:Guanine nucleotide exchange factor in Golgi transport N-terminal